MNVLRRIKRDLKMFIKIKKIEKTYKEKPNEFNKEIPYVNKPGIVLSFDDSVRVKHWYTYGKDLFGFYKVKATFNINAMLPFVNRLHSQEEIDMLIELQHNGHELVHHGYSHKDAVKYTAANGENKWLQDDIDTLIDWMDKQAHSVTKEKMKKPVSFAFPYSSYNESIVNELIPKYFKVCRGHFNKNKFHDLVSFEQTGFVPSICIDSNILPDVRFIKPMLKLAKRTGKNIILMCHSILPEEINWNDFNWGPASLEASEYRITPKSLLYIIQEAKKLDLEFYTLSEIGGIASFIDANFESTIREKFNINFQQKKFISINDLININKLDLSSRNISNLGGIEYFFDLEELDLSNNNITDIRILSKLKKLRTVNLKNNYISNSSITVLDKSVKIIL
ncbi:MAG: Polysaccharide deacetylase [Clostridiaceae bacterium]|jgi:peptidoglycan/xylan/chitin deacetylase (PgdA/CDA1 family)|nr:Polysaccharide deacetylase [Clostridiaceae bacterium]